jgi:hypothetical protein
MTEEVVMSLATLLKENNDLTNHDLAVLADWANRRKLAVKDTERRRAFSLIREGADTLLRQRVQSNGETTKKENV